MIQPQHHTISPQTSSSGIGFKSVAKYALLPGFIPLLKRLAQRFGEFFHMFTMIFGAVGLIDKNHPCLRPENAGAYRFTDILGLAAHNVVFDRKHIPQIVMFFAVILAIVLCVAMIVVMFANVALSASHAYAQNYFSPLEGTTYKRETDWAFIFLNNVFGETGIGNLIWNLSDDDPGGKGASRLQAMFRAMLAHYAQGILVLAVFLLIYIIVMTLVDSAKTGKPFGSKFDNVWAPIRLALAIGLMIPIGSGYNAAQMVVFQMADWGSNFATNVWVTGLNKLANDEKFLEATIPDRGYNFIRGLWLSEVCMAAWNQNNHMGVTTRLANISLAAALNGTHNAGATVMAIYKNTFGAVPPSDQVLPSEDFIGDNMYFEVRYGTPSDMAYCGRFRIPVEQGVVRITTIDGQTLEVNEFGQIISQKYQKIYEDLVDEIRPAAEDYAEKVRTTCKYMDVPNTDEKHWKWIIDTYWKNIGFKPANYASDEAKGTLLPTIAKDPSPKEAKFFEDPVYINAIKSNNTALLELIKSGSQGGWASAGAFYMMIAYANGAMNNAISTVPTVVDLPKPFAGPDFPPNDPSLMDKVMTLSTTPYSSLFGNADIRKAAKETYSAVRAGNAWFAQAPTKNPYLLSWLGDPFRTLIIDEEAKLSQQGNASLGQDQKIKPLAYEGLFAVQSNDVNPLGRLVSMGSRFFAISASLYATAFVVSSWIAGGSSAAGSFFSSLAMLFGMAGFSLAVYLPMMPFIHFTFAVIEWVMSVLEAIIGMPLWALSMITTEGDGLGRTAQGGFMKLVGIVLQPTIIVISLIASLIMFSACISFFNGAFALFSNTYSNTAGGGGGGALNQLTGGFASAVGAVSFTFMYAFICYSIGQSCFKLISKIPNEFTSWYGGSRPFSAQMDAGMSTISSYVGMQQLNNLQKSAGDSYRGTRDGMKKQGQERKASAAFDKLSDEDKERFGTKEAYGNHLAKMESDVEYRDKQMSANVGGGGSSGSSGYRATENDVKDMRSYRDELTDIAQRSGEDSTEFKMANDLYKHRTGGHDYKKDIKPKNADKYGKYMSRSEAVRNQLEEDLFSGPSPKHPGGPQAEEQRKRREREERRGRERDGDGGGDLE